MDGKNKTFIDNQGYRRFMDTKDLVHRWVAYHQVYKKDRKKFPLPFSDYQIHHRDHNKLNNNPDNLELITGFEHTITHKKFDSQEWLIIKSLGVIILGIVIMFIYVLILITNKSGLNIYTSLPIFIIMILIYVFVNWIMRRSKIK